MLLIDADFILYKNAAACETEIDYNDDLIVVQSRFSDLQRAFTYDIKQIVETTGVSEYRLYFSDSKNFRKAIYPEYKGQRTRKKPCGYKRAIEWLASEQDVVIVPYLEADDVIGIVATSEPDKHTIVSPDKDLLQIPGHLYDPSKRTSHFTTEEEGRNWHLIQSLAGDQTDGYPGCPGLGIKRAATLFDTKGYTWETLVEAYEKAELTEADALTQARLARILQTTDYDSEVIPWVPSGPYLRAELGATPDDLKD